MLVKKGCVENIVLVELHDKLEEADRKSFEVFSRILSEGAIKKMRIMEQNGLPDAVCLSECSLPGVLSHSERFGRFGFMFEKNDIYDLGGRPCAYVDQDVSNGLKQLRQDDVKCSVRSLDGYANTYCPASPMRLNGAKVQDYMLEREWRIMKDLPLVKLFGVLCPYRYYLEIFSIVEHAVRDKTIERMVPIFPLDVLYRWGV